MDTFHAVGEFHGKFGLPTAYSTPPALPAEDVVRFRVAFLIEELAELAGACGLPVLEDDLMRVRNRVKDVEHYAPYARITEPNLAQAADALADLKYVLDGTAHLFGIPLNEVFAEVHRANLQKERASSAADARSTRGHALDVVKPEGWRPPDHGPILARHAARFAPEG